MFVEMMQSSGGGGDIDDLVSTCGTAGSKTIVSGKKYICVAGWQERTTDPAALSDRIYGDITDLEIMSYQDAGSSSRVYCLRFKATGTSLTIATILANTAVTLIREP